jgi:arylsulfatase
MPPHRGFVAVFSALMTVSEVSAEPPPVIDSRATSPVAAEPFSASRPAVARADKPNFVFILADNLGYGELGCYGGGLLRGAPTPIIDRLAREGLRLLNFNVESQCTPTRSALMTGRFPIRSGTGKVPRGGDKVAGLTQWEITLAEILADHGYATGLFGKWHLGESEGRYPTDQGFDEWYGIANTSGLSAWTSAVGFDPAVVPVSQIMEAVKGSKARAVGIYDLDARRRIDAEVTRRAIHFLARSVKSGAPFFAYVPITQVHLPTLPHPDFAGKTGHGDGADALAEMDHRVGEILAAVKDLGIENNTIVVFASDNGPEETLPWRGSAGPWSGSIGTAMEGSLRTPFLLRWPGRVAPGRESNEIVHAVDVFTTFVGLAGAKVPTDRIIDGADQTAFFLGEQAKSNREGFPSFIGDTLYAVKWRNWKAHFIWQEYKGDAAERLPIPRLFNLIDDPRERDPKVSSLDGWVHHPVGKIVADLEAGLKREPPITPGTPDPYCPPAPVQ